MFIKFKRPNGQPLIVNADLVLTLTDGNGVTLRMHNGDFHTVKGTLVDVFRQLNQVQPG